MESTVAIFGAGVAGLTAAHELALRGFSVDVYERHAVPGGKARSFGEPGTGTDGRSDLPRTMGGHFFILGYQNLDETLRRIPLRGGGTVPDNLSPKNGFVWVLDDAIVTADIPRDSGVLRNWFSYAMFGARLLRHFTLSDIAVFGSKALALTTSGDRRTWDEFEHTSMPDYFRSDRLSPNARKHADFSGWAGISKVDGCHTRLLATGAACVVNAVLQRRPRGERTIMRVAAAPENEALFDPWVEHLRSLGVRFHFGRTVTRLDIAGGRANGAETDRGGVSADWYVLAVPADKAATLMSQDIVQTDPQLGRIQNIRHAEMGGVQIFLKHRVPELRSMIFTINGWETANEVLSSFWNRDIAEYGDGTVRAVISMQLTDRTFTELPGELYGKPAKYCSPQELIDEILHLLRTQLPDGQRLIADEAIHSWHPYPGMSYRDGEWIIDEPLLASSPSSWQNQPNQETAIDNLLLAGAYTRAILSGESMDAANESGKRAAASILRKSGVHAEPIHINEFKHLPGTGWLRRWDDRRYRAGKPNIFDVVAPYRAG
ncbi:FAD-dependent oxidoreductase [Mycobacterium sp. CBMA271]|uniref:hydroxysqualene dehydroxylase n=1 Tax=unclassified Mycobacteroides TaxID=2618759 RepID=UPI0012DD8116|nr:MULTISPECIES: FAD-dependent oxidoreductase [unclassified Mycobacteroides]MUM17899.1 hypothetical protein [Mycobacteroides sp. CBMA 326]MUM20468.1 FAD-dependent oxidoreductase [Mycobacteroides sp. CBMA 271]